MVFSATSVKAYAETGSAFHAIINQALYALLGLVAFWICQRLPAMTLRYIGKYVLGVAIVLLALLDLINGLESVHLLHAAADGTIRRGPRSARLLWLYIGPIGLQPAEVAKLGKVIWGDDIIVCL